MSTDYQQREAVMKGEWDRYQRHTLRLPPVKVRVLTPFSLGHDRIAQVGEEIELGAFDARSLAAIGRVEVLKA